MFNYKSKIKEVLGWSTYKNTVFYRSLIKKGDLCFDIGANKGAKSKLFLSLGAKVIAFEPQGNCQKHLSQISHKQFTYKMLGVGAENGAKELQIGSHIEVATFSQEFIDYFETKTLKWDTSEAVEVKKIDTLIEAYGIPDFCKIDVEGYELEIVKSLSYLIPLVEFEFTGGFIPEAVSCIIILNKNDAQYNFNLHEQPKLELNKWVGAEEMVNIIEKLPIKRLHGNIFVKNNRNIDFKN